MLADSVLREQLGRSLLMETGSMRVSSTFGNPLPKPDSEIADTQDTFRILVLTDVGGSVPWGKPVTVDRDNIDEVMQRLNVRLSIDAQPDLPAVEVPFSELDDFHPDRLFERLEIFASLRRRRQRLQDDATFAEEADAIRATEDVPRESPPGAAEPTRSESPPVAAPKELLSAALEQTQAARKPIVQQIAEGSLSVDALVQRLVAPYVLDKPDARKPEFVAAVDRAISATMRNVLHHPAFQQLEAAWLGIKMLVRRLETDSTLQISVLNVSQQQLREDLCGSDELDASKLYKLLVESTGVAGAEPWTAVVGNYTFDASADDTALLGRIAQVHAAAGTVFVSGVSPGVVGCSDLAEAPDPDDWSPVSDEQREVWQSLRSLPATASVILALPRILGRRPYGNETDPIDSFQFEEIPDGNAHEQFLWVNAAFAVTTLLGQSFSHSGWSLTASWKPGLEDLPIHVYEDDGEELIKPCAEVELLLRAGNVFAESGLTAVHSVRDHDSIRIPSLLPLSSTMQSVASCWH
jgi:type VI secretion system protein ImpC